MGDQITQVTIKWPQYLAGLAASGGGFVIGMALGWPAPLERRLLEDQEQGFEITAAQWDWIGSVITIGCAISCLPIGMLMNKFGRKWTMLGLVVPFLLGWGLIIWAKNFVMMIIGRLFIGLAGGAFCISAPLYSAEISENQIRGITGTFFQLLLNLGILFIYCIGPYIPAVWTNVACALLTIAFGVVFFFMPESPVFLVIENREEEARKSYSWLRGVNFDPQHEIRALREELEESERNKVSFREVMRLRSSKMATFIGFGLVFFFQMSGLNIVIFYSTRIFELANVNMDADISTIIMGSINFVFTIVGGLLVDRLGRRILLMISIVGVTICTCALGAFFFLAELDDQITETLGWLPLTSLSIFLITFSLGYGPIVWLMVSEVYSKELSGFISPFTGAFNWTFAFIITLTFRPIVDLISIGPTFWIFTGTSFVGILFTFFIIPETKGKSMAEIQLLLSGKKDTQKNKFQR